MAPEHAAVLTELRERAFTGGAQSVEFMTQYYGRTREVRFGVRLERNGWDHSIYSTTLPDLFRAFEHYLQERGW